MFKTTLALLTLAAVATANLAGISVDNSAFAIANINPDTGASVASTTTITTRPGGELAFSATVLSGNDMFWSLQTDNANQAYLVSQDLKVRGRRDECWISTDANGVRPIHLFQDTVAGSVIATGVSSGSFGIYRFSVNPNNRICTATLLGTVSGVSSMAPLTSTQLNNRIFFAYEATATPFSSSSGPVLASYDVSDAAVTRVSTTSASAGLYFTSIAASSATTVIAQGFNAKDTSVTFGTWTIDLSADSTSTRRTSTTVEEQISTSSAFVAQSSGHYTQKMKTTTSVATTANLAFFDFATTATTTAEVTRDTAISNKVFKLFDMMNSKITAIDADSSLANTVRLSGNNLYSAATSSLSTCRFTVGTTVATTAPSAIGSSTVDGVACTFNTGIAAGSRVRVEFAADGVNYVEGPSFVYGSSTASSAKFTRRSYSLEDGVAFSSNRSPISVELFDSNGSKLLFSSAITGTLTAESADSSFAGAAAGNSASSTNGLLTFPDFSVDVFATNAANNLANIKLRFTSGTIVASADATVRFIRESRSTTLGLGLASSAFSYTLVNPSNTAAASTSLGTRTFTATNTMAFGLSTFDYENDVLNTVEINSSGSPLLVGLGIRSSTPAAGAGTCIIPTTTTSSLRDTPIAIAYEGTDATTKSSTFLAVVILTATTGANYKIVRYTRVVNSAETTTCTVSTIAELPQTEVAYAHVAFLSNARIALIERDTVFSTTGPNNLLHVYQIGDTTTAGSWKIRNKALTFSAIAITQSGENEVAISGRSGSTDGVWRVDITSDNSAVLAPVALRETFSTASEQAYFLAAGNSFSSDSRLRISGSVTSTGSRQADVVQLLGGATSNGLPSTAVNVNDYVSLFSARDPVVTAVSNDAANAVTVTANYVINAGTVTCRFSSSGVTSVAVAATISTAAGSFPANGATYTCGTIPATFLSGSRAVFVALANDATNFGPAGCISVGTTNQCPTINGVTATGTPANVPSTTGSTTIPISRQLVFFFTGKAQTDCAASVALVNAFFTAAGVKFTTVTEADCAFNANYIPTAVTTSAVRMLQGTSGIVINSVLETAADKNAAVTAFNANPIPGATVNDANPAVAASDDDDGLTDGEIAGIVIGSVAGVVLIGALIAFALKGSSKKAPASSGPAATYSTRDATFTDATTASGSYDSTGASGSYDSTSGSYDSDSGSYDSEDYSDYSGSSYV